MRCPDCGNETGIGLWPWCPHGHVHHSLDPNTHPSDRVVVYESAQEGGKIQYPGRNDTPVPERLRRRGYVRKEINVSELGAFERKHGVTNERRHYDRNGRGI